MQNLPYSALMNPHITHVYELYYSAFEKLRKVPEIKTLDDNDRLCVRHALLYLGYDLPLTYNSRKPSGNVFMNISALSLASPWVCLRYKSMFLVKNVTA